MNVSVIIPVYNGEKFIEKAISSCLQLSEVKEIVLVDDGYKDRAKEIIQELAGKHPIIKLYEHPNNENRGAGASRNLGIEKATQEYIAFLDADDFFLPNRFAKDKEVLQRHPDADGCYNAIGCFFYSDTAKDIFFKHFKSEITTVNLLANPTPENLFRGRIGLIPDFGHFSLDGLTVNRNCILSNKLTFPISSMHEDTAFIIKLAYYARLYPSELTIPVTLRGVHEQNRITENYQSNRIKQYHNQFKLWNQLYDWSVEESIGKTETNYLRKIANFYRLLSSRSPKPKELIKEILSHPRLLFNDYYPQLHTTYFGNSLIASFLLRVRNDLTQLLTKLLKKHNKSVSNNKDFEKTK